jgi:hypothetical protein
VTKISAAFIPPFALASFLLAIYSILSTLITIATNDINVYRSHSLQWFVCFVVHTIINAGLFVFGETNKFLRYSLIATNITALGFVVPRMFDLWLR